jgi:MscS family membrane protein
MILLHGTLYYDRILQARYVFVSSFLVWIFFRWKKSFEKILTRKILKNSKNKKNDQIIISAVSKLVVITIVIFFILMVLDVFGIPLSGLLAFGGVSGIAVSWAAKDIVANFFGGFMIYMNRPFVIGDWIKSTNKDFEGTVVDIGWYMTQLVTFEQRPLYVPNALVTDAIIENPGRMVSRRINEIIALRYDDLKYVKNIIADIEAMLKNHPDIDEKNILRVLLEHFNDYSIDICVYAFSKVTDGTGYRKVKQDLLLKIADIIEEHGAEIAFPTQLIQLKK